MTIGPHIAVRLNRQSNGRFGVADSYKALQLTW
jgi:hypothetical protein